jgi:hypothetical protein
MRAQPDEATTRLVLWGSNSRVECARVNDRPVRGGQADAGAGVGRAREKERAG